MHASISVDVNFRNEFKVKYVGGLEAVSDVRNYFKIVILLNFL
jgi:hypothetical protein